jgi:formylmethanofuran dehydrogenase subunit A
MSGLVKIAGGRLIDPLHGVDEEPRDLWIRDGRIIDAPVDPSVRPDRTIDARGYVVMPGGVDVHCHVAGAKVDASRFLRPEQRRNEIGAAFPPEKGFSSGTIGSCPTAALTGRLYAGMGYTTVNDAAIAPAGAFLAHEELAETPLVDRGFLTLAGNHRYLLEVLREGQSVDSKVESFVRWLVWRTGSLGIKVVNPGGIETWKQGLPRISALDDQVPEFGISPRMILESLCKASAGIGLPHPVHLHSLNLGLPGNCSTTAETLRALSGLPVHLAHVQFHSYGGDPNDPASLRAEVDSLVELVNDRPEITVDVGQVLFGNTTVMTADGATAQYLGGLTKKKLLLDHVELETGCGVMPIEYRDKNHVHAVQWATGLEWFLRTEDPWQIALSTDHPNGAAFTAYPELMALLADAGYRRECFEKLPESVRDRSGLKELTREYTLSEIAIVTRAAPARMLGLVDKGHLGPGADADVTIYQPDSDFRRMFAMPRWVLKAGEVIVDDTEIRKFVPGTTHRFDQNEPDAELIEPIRRWWLRNATSAWETADIGDSVRSELRVISPRGYAQRSSGNG